MGIKTCNKVNFVHGGMMCIGKYSSDGGVYQWGILNYAKKSTDTHSWFCHNGHVERV